MNWRETLPPTTRWCVAWIARDGKTRGSGSVVSDLEYATRACKELDLIEPDLIHWPAVYREHAVQDITPPKLRQDMLLHSLN